MKKKVTLKVLLLSFFLSLLLGELLIFLESSSSWAYRSPVNPQLKSHTSRKSQVYNQKTRSKIRRKTYSRPKRPRPGSLVNLIASGYRITGPNTLEIIVSAVSGPNHGRLTPEEERKAKVVIYLQKPGMKKGFPPSYERKTYVLSSPLIRKKFLSGSTIYYIKLTNVVTTEKEVVIKVVVDPFNKIPEQNERDNEKEFKIPYYRLASTSFARVDLLVHGYRVASSRTVEFIITAAPKLSKEDERKAQVRITLPDGKKRNFLLSSMGIKKTTMPTHVVNYTITLHNVTSGGNFKVEVDPSNLISEWDERNNTKTFNIPTSDIERRWEAGLDLIASRIFVKKSHTVSFNIINHGRKLRPDEEKKCKVRISYPVMGAHNRPVIRTVVGDLSGFNKHQFGKTTYYSLEVSNVIESGVFKLEVDINDAIFEQREDNNVLTVNIEAKKLSRLRIVSPSSPVNVLPHGTVNLRWEYHPPQGYTPGGGFQFNYEILDLSGNRVIGPTPIYDQNEPNGSYTVRMPLLVGTYRIKLSIRDFAESYDITAPIHVVAPPLPSNPQGFAITSQIPSEIRNGSTITFAWEADPNKYDQIKGVVFLRPDFTGCGGDDLNSPINSSSGSFSVRITLQNVEFTKGKADIFLKVKLKRKGTSQVDYYIIPKLIRVIK